MVYDFTSVNIRVKVLIDISESLSCTVRSRWFELRSLLFHLMSLSTGKIPLITPVGGGKRLSQPSECLRHRDQTRWQRQRIRFVVLDPLSQLLQFENLTVNTAQHQAKVAAVLPKSPLMQAQHAAWILFWGSDEGINELR